MESGANCSKIAHHHESLYQHVYSDKAQGGVLWMSLSCQNQKRKRYAGGRDRRWQTPNRRPLSERHLHNEARRQVGHWEFDTVIDASHKNAFVSIVERKCGYAVLDKVVNITSDLVSPALLSNLNPFSVRAKTLTYDNGKEFAGHSLIDL